MYIKLYTNEKNVCGVHNTNAYTLQPSQLDRKHVSLSLSLRARFGCFIIKVHNMLMSSIVVNVKCSTITAAALEK